MEYQILLQLTAFPSQSTISKSFTSFILKNFTPDRFKAFKILAESLKLTERRYTQPNGRAAA
jgi:hypothetical protein